MKHVLIIEAFVKQPFDDELETLYAEASEEDHAAKVELIQSVYESEVRKWAEADGEISVNVRVEEEAVECD